MKMTFRVCIVIVQVVLCMGTWYGGGENTKCSAEKRILNKRPNISIEAKISSIRIQKFTDEDR